MNQTMKAAAFGIAVPLMLIALACGGGSSGDQTGKTDQNDSGQAAASRSAVADQILTTMVVIDAVESAGFHDMAKALAEATEVNTRYTSTVSNVLATMKKGVWPSELQASTAKLTADLTSLEAALKKNDLEGARTGSEAVHDSQHDFSIGVYSWLAGQAGKLGNDSEDILLASLSAIDVIDSAGFHDMAKALAEATEVNARDATKAGNVLAVTKATTWPEAIRAEEASFVTDAQALKDSLDRKDLTQARTAVEAVHDSQHDLSQAFYAWLGKQPRLTHRAGAVHADLCTLKVTDMVNSAGFHDMAKDLAQATDINARYAGKVENTVRAMMVMTWSAGDSAAAAKLTEIMESLHQALAAGDLAKARTYSEEIHDAQHDFANGVYAHMMGMTGH